MPISHHRGRKLQDQDRTAHKAGKRGSEGGVLEPHSQGSNLWP